MDNDTAAGSRNYTMLLLLLDTGLRLSEMINLKLDDVNLKGGYLMTLGRKVLNCDTATKSAICNMSAIMNGTTPR